MSRVLVVSDVRLYRDGLCRLLQGSGSIEVVGAAADVAAGIELGGRTAPEVIVLHVVTQDGTSAVRQLSIAVPTAEVVVLALREEASEVIAHAEAGAAGYLALEGSLSDLVSTIDDLAHGKVQISPHIARALLRRVHTSAGDRRPKGHIPRLTQRELEVMDLVERGLANKEIARCLGIGIATVKNHVHSILDKIGLPSRGEAGAWARTHLADSLAKMRITGPN